nr:MAG TPA: hypothetical protein [Caudoviricetes sp.]
MILRCYSYFFIFLKLAKNGQKWAIFVVDYPKITQER